MIYKKSWKYILIKDSSYLCSASYLYRLKAVKDFGNVYKKNLGGYVKGYHNLSQKGNCWVYDNAWVCENAKLSENAKAYGESRISGNAMVCENARIFDDAKVSGNTIVSGFTSINRDI